MWGHTVPIITSQKTRALCIALVVQCTIHSFTRFCAAQETGELQCWSGRWDVTCSLDLQSLRQYLWSFRCESLSAVIFLDLRWRYQWSILLPRVCKWDSFNWKSLGSSPQLGRRPLSWGVLKQDHRIPAVINKVSHYWTCHLPICLLEENTEGHFLLC